MGKKYYKTPNISIDFLKIRNVIMVSYVVNEGDIGVSFADIFDGSFTDSFGD